MIGTIVSFLAGPGGKIAGYIGAALGVFVIYQVWENKVEQAALAEFNKKQMEQALQDSKKALEVANEVNKVQQDNVKILLEKNEEMAVKFGKVEEWLSGAKGDKPASDLLKETIKRLGEGR